MKTAMVICSECNKEFSVYVHKKNKDAGWYIENLPNCKHHKFNKNKKNTIHKRRNK